MVYGGILKLGTSTKKQQSTSCLVATICNDPTALAALADALRGLLLDAPHIAALVDAIEAVNAGKQRNAPGKLYAGTIPNNASNLILNGSSQPITALVSLNGSSTPVSVYVPTHLRASIAIGQAVWVLAVNGAMSDLIVFSIRNIF
jgi:hypothetical protein